MLPLALFNFTPYPLINLLAKNDRESGSCSICCAHLSHLPDNDAACLSTMQSLQCVPFNLLARNDTAFNLCLIFPGCRLLSNNETVCTWSTVLSLISLLAKE